ncbi:MAG: lipopolysaccharide biosynthesis protein [Paracoccaceae bacterium]
MDFRFYLSLFLRRLHWFVIVAVVISGVGITLARYLPTVYIAQATLVVESEQIPDALAASTVLTQATEQLQIIQQRILTRDTLVEMANRLQIYAIPGRPAQPMDADELVKDLRKRINIVTTGGGDTRGQATLVVVSFEAPTAALAASVANDVVTQILKTDVEMRTGSARQTLDFFEQEVDRLDKEMTIRGARILKFKEANKDALPDSVEFRRTQQAAAQERLLQLQRDEAELRDRRTRLVRLHEASGDAQTTPPQQQSPEQQKLGALHDQLAAQLTVLSPENPKVKMLQTQITALEKVVASQSSAGQVDAQGRAMSAYDVQVADIDGQLAYMAEQKTQITAQMQTLQTTIEATPGNAIALDTLQRDYDNLRAQYDQAVANKARAATGDTIETMAKGQRITVIEQAVAPRDPSRPHRTLIAVGGVVGGLTLGLALVALIEFLHLGIRRPADLTAKLGITTFATLPYLTTDREIRWRRLRQLVLVLLVLAAIAAALWAINTYYMPLDLLMDRVIKRISLISGLAPNLA